VIASVACLQAHEGNQQPHPISGCGQVLAGSLRMDPTSNKNASKHLKL